MDLLIQDGALKLRTFYYPYAFAVYWADIDNNGLKDFIVFYTGRSNGLGFQGDTVQLFLKVSKNEYRQMYFETACPDIEDYVDLNKDKKAEVIITGFYFGEKHNYFTYSIYEFRDYKLVNVDEKYIDFPKFVWLSFEPNDKDTIKLSKEIRDRIVREKDLSINYNDKSY